MAESLNKIVLIGASGILGPSVLEVLLSEPFDITVISRQESSAKFPPAVKVVKSDFSHDSLVAAFKDKDAVVSIVGAAQLGAQSKYINAAIAAGVKRFIPSEFGSDTSNPKIAEGVPIFAYKVQTLEHLKSHESEIEWSAVANGPFVDWALKSRFYDFYVPDKTATVYDGGDVQVSMSTLAQVGRAVAKVLQHPAETKNKFVFVDSFTVSLNDILKSVEKITGSKFSVKDVSTDSITADGRKALANGDYSGIPNLLLGAIFKANADYSHDFKTFQGGLWNKKLGLVEENLDDVVRQFVKESSQ